jgi:hypothetical protein
MNNLSPWKSMHHILPGNLSRKCVHGFGMGRWKMGYESGKLKAFASCGFGGGRAQWQGTCQDNSD